MNRPSFFNLRLLLGLGVVTLAAGCAGPAPYVYRYVPGRTATVSNGIAIAPPKAPRRVKAAIAAGNRIAGLPYARGGGHGRGIDTAYDCSGATSFVLQAAGAMRGTTTSTGFRKYGRSGPGKWITVYARKGHVFLSVAGLRYDTGWGGAQSQGPRWTTRTRPAKGCVLRHPPGL